MNIAVIGSGNIATFFSRKLNATGFKIVQVMSKNIENAKALAAEFHCEATDQLSALDKTADIFLFAVKDDILLEMVKKISLPGKLVIHTAGSVGLVELSTISEQVACIWPVYSVQKDKIPARENIPLVINAANEEALQKVIPVAAAISDLHYFLSDDQKKQLHLAAVFANNFTNHLYTLSKRILEEKNIPFDILHPMIQATAEKLLQNDPEQNQTGPAIRHDEKTIEKHLEMLGHDEHLLHLYLELTRSIQH